jgi:hypothetical protein
VLVEVEAVPVAVLLFLCLCDFFVLFIVLVSVLPVDVFWANTAVPESNDKPRAAIMIFFIRDVS